jgi:signal transduction histidine kinase
MGRVSPRPAVRAGRRRLHQRPLVLFGLLLLVPAAGSALLGWQSVRREWRLETMAADAEARDLVERILETEADGLAALARVEAERPYYAYQTHYLPEPSAVPNLGFQASPLGETPEDPRIRGWFLWERGADGVAFERPEAFGPNAEAVVEGLVQGYGAALRHRLEGAQGDVETRAGRRVEHSLLVIAANEERGQLLEEMQVLQGAQNGLRAQFGVTPYLESFYDRVGDAAEVVAVRYGPFRHLARAKDAPGPGLVAWRLVWIPAAHGDRREAARDRWVLQGYALDAGARLPAAWQRVGRARLARGDVAGEGAGSDARHDTLARALDAEVLGADEDDVAPTLRLVAVPDAAALADGYLASRARFLWIASGLLVVVAIGFVVLARGVRREVALARRKEDFVAAVTHELKTPLAGIRMHADMLREGWVKDPDAARRYAERILDESDRLGHLVDQVLDLAALERGVATAHAVPGDLAPVVRDAVGLVASRAEQAGVRLEADLPDGLPPVRHDPRLVRPLVLNLLDNAIKYSAHAPEKHVRVSLAREGDRVVLTVADRGVGIAPSVRRRLFEPFQRAGDELTRTAPGVGIGLALVKRYADAHDARVSLDSEPGRGTTVTVRFPA